MEEKIKINNIEYLLKYDNPLTLEERNSVINQLAMQLQSLSTNCITSANVGDNLKLTNNITSGTPPYHAIFRKGSIILQDIPNLYTTQQTVTYPVVAGDIGTVRFILDVSDSCKDGAKSTTNYCDIVITAPVTTGYLAFDSNPHGAQIVLDGTLLPNTYTPSTISGVAAGNHSYEFRLTGYNNFFGNATAIVGQTVVVPTAQLVSIVTTGDLAFDSNPQGASVTLNGQVQQLPTPITFHNLPTGAYSYILKKDGYDDYPGNATVIAGQTVVVPTAQLVPTPTCNGWITRKGGTGAIRNNLTALGNIIDGYLGTVSLGFTVSLPCVGTVINYYLGV